MQPHHAWRRNKNGSYGILPAAASLWLTTQNHTCLIDTHCNKQRLPHIHLSLRGLAGHEAERILSLCVHRISKLPRGSVTALTRTELTSVQCWCVNCSIHKCFVFLILKRRHFHRAFWPCEPAKCTQSASCQATMTSSAGLTSLPLGLPRLGWTNTESVLVWISPPPTQAAELLSNYIVDSICATDEFVSYDCFRSYRTEQTTENAPAKQISTCACLLKLFLHFHSLPDLVDWKIIHQYI